MVLRLTLEPDMINPIEMLSRLHELARDQRGLERACMTDAAAKLNARGTRLEAEASAAGWGAIAYHARREGWAGRQFSAHEAVEQARALVAAASLAVQS